MMAPVPVLGGAIWAAVAAAAAQQVQELQIDELFTEDSPESDAEQAQVQDDVFSDQADHGAESTSVDRME